jgi:uncharacterized RDD family membrane protein YckC
MINDSVREELETKISAPLRKPEPTPMAEPVAAPAVIDETPKPKAVLSPPKREIPRPMPPLKRETNPLNVPKTSPTLVEFQNKNATIPDWRLQLQNSIRQRKGGNVSRPADAVSEPVSSRTMTNGATALKVEIVEDPQPQPVNEKIANALKRIDESRKNFLPENTKRSPKPAPRNYPFNVVSRAPETAAAQKQTRGRIAISDPPKPTLVPTFKIDKKKFDTNKLPPIVDEALQEVDPETLPVADTPKPAPPALKPEISIHKTSSGTGELTLTETGEIEDLAPVSMRFNAALFDLIIGAFASFVLLSPIVLMGGDWFSLSGIAAFAGVWATTMFIYMTLSIGMYGKTLGMRMFGLELIDAEENDYPTFHQAAVHSAVFLLSLPFLGIGFVPMIFNEEQRAAHDLAAGTMIVTEF